MLLINQTITLLIRWHKKSNCSCSSLVRWRVQWQNSVGKSLHLSCPFPHHLVRKAPCLKQSNNIFQKKTSFGKLKKINKNKRINWLMSYWRAYLAVKHDKFVNFHNIFWLNLLKWFEDHIVSLKSLMQRVAKGTKSVLSKLTTVLTYSI